MSSSRHDALQLSLCLHILVSSLGRLHVVIPSLDRLHIVAFSVGRRCLFFGSADEHSTCALPCIFSTPYLLCLSISWYHLHLCMHARALSPSLPSTLPPSYPTLKPAQDHSTHPNSNLPPRQSGDSTSTTGATSIHHTRNADTTHHHTRTLESCICADDTCDAPHNPPTPHHR